jgi:hypothetical protein
MTEPNSAEAPANTAAKPAARSGRIVVLAITALITLWTLVLGALLWRGVQEPRWLQVRDPEAGSKSPDRVVIPSKPAPTTPPANEP